MVTACTVPKCFLLLQIECMGLGSVERRAGLTGLGHLLYYFINQSDVCYNLDIVEHNPLDRR